MSKKRNVYRPLAIEEEATAPGKVSKKRRYIPKPEKIRADALASNEGGRMRCDYCEKTFGAYYVTLVYAKWPHEPNYACRNCREDLKLRKV